MNKAVTVLFIIFLLLIIGETAIGIYVMETQLKWRYYYEYINLDGEVGRSANCYEYKGSIWCRDAKNVFKVISYVQKRERR